MTVYIITFHLQVRVIAVHDDWSPFYGVNINERVHYRALVSHLIFNYKTMEIANQIKSNQIAFISDNKVRVTNNVRDVMADES